MTNFWSDHWWLLIPLGAFTIPLAGIALGVRLGAISPPQPFDT